MREWIPISTSPKGRLVLEAARAFGTRPYDEVTVTDLSRAAEVTTGALYHHFEGKQGLYGFVRADIERRLLDRIEGAAAAMADDDPSARLSAAMTVGFEYAVRGGFLRLLADPPRTGDTDELAEALGGLCVPASAQLGVILAAAWRAAVGAVAGGTDADAVREALERLHVTCASADDGHPIGADEESPRPTARGFQDVGEPTWWI
ncbi:TetR family transcriptional regulator [Agromyces sp. CFH 90414]|uniref:TetR family transcriptional regulator n=1 Tax=Agromyces agglutinans TaxID=2662258 RepID=A0A6I2F7U9_9MICO|nr:TetR/AcrR family transcriptional regulator [Agromyces agglutinans]MRG58466.1 TetR family transcriptional regulator [Agromyces agglutinans]